jgi:branched-chain amino acid transport system substrate-binding protein
MLRRVFEDFGGSVLGKPIELLVADHQNKVDVGLAVARQWYDARGVRAIFDITNSGVGLAVQDLAKARDRIVIFDSASSSDLTGKACSPNGVQWNADNWSNGVALMRLLIKQKLDSFFFVTADYAFGASLDATRETPSPRPVELLSAACARRSTPPISVRFSSPPRRRRPR